MPIDFRSGDACASPSPEVRQVGRERYQIIAPKLLSGASEAAVQRFIEALPNRPYCSRDLSRGLVIRPQRTALQHPYIQINVPWSRRYLIFDVDYRGGALAAYDANLPPPNIAIINPANGHAHLVYTLAKPVHNTALARSSPLSYLAAIERGFVRRLPADWRYAGLIAKNPLHPAWQTSWGAAEPYGLANLADALFPRDMASDGRPDIEFGLGRNCTLFDQLRAIAYHEVRSFKRQSASLEDFRACLFQEAEKLNQQFPVPLPVQELNSIAASVAKWVWQRFSLQNFSKIQSWRASQTRRKTRERLALLDRLFDGGPDR